MDYFEDAFGGFEPQTDKDAAIKFCLNAILMDGRFEDLVRLSTDGEAVGGVEGCPGWLLEREDGADAGPPVASSNGRWDSRFGADVDPEAYALAHPEGVMERKAFLRYAKAALRAFVNRNPSRADAASALASLVSMGEVPSRKTYFVDCSRVNSESEFWQAYLLETQPKGADNFGRNLDAFWDALNGGPGWPGDCTLVFRNMAVVKEFRHCQFYRALVRIALASEFVEVVFE